MLRITRTFSVGLLLILGTATAAAAQTLPAPVRPQTPATPQLFSPQPNKPFPEGAKIGFVDFQLVAQESAAGKAATLQLKALQNVKFAEVEAKNQALKTLQAQQASAGLAAGAAAKIQRDIDRAQLDIQYTRQVAQKEIDDMNDQLMTEFSTKVRPIVEEIRAEHGLWAVFVIGDTFVAPMSGVDISMEVVKKLDAKKTDSPIGVD